MFFKYNVPEDMGMFLRRSRTTPTKSTFAGSDIVFIGLVTFSMSWPSLYHTVPSLSRRHAFSRERSIDYANFERHDCGTMITPVNATFKRARLALVQLNSFF